MTAHDDKRDEGVAALNALAEIADAMDLPLAESVSVERLKGHILKTVTVPSHEQRIHEGRGSQPAGALVSGSPHLAAREANPGSAVPGGVDRHERRVVGHASGWQEQMDTCVCGKPWPCASAASTIGELERLRAFESATVESEARCCPEDFGFEEWIGILTKRLSAASARGTNSDAERLDWLQSQLKKGWGDGFAMHPLDGGALYPRPWRKALEAVDYMAPDLKTGAYLWQPDVRTAIDEAMRRADGGKQT